MSRPWSIVEDGLVIALTELGYGGPAIGAMIDRGRQAVFTRRVHLRKQGVAVRRQPPRSALLRGDTQKRLRKLWAAGLSASEIGRRLGRHENTIDHWVRRLQLPRRRPAGASMSEEDAAFVVRHYRRVTARWIAGHLPSGRHVTRLAVIGFYNRRKNKRSGTPATVSMPSVGLEAPVG